MFIEDNLNQNLLNLWESHYQDDNNAIMPLFYGPLKHNALLFNGLNPSFSEQVSLNCFKTQNFPD